MRTRWLLTHLILIGLIAGVIVGQLLYDPDYKSIDPAALHRHQAALDLFEFFGSSVFMALLKMLIIPLIMSSIIYGVVSVGDVSALGRIGAKTMIYYFVTMLVAVTVGLTLVNLIKPGVGVIGPDQITEARQQADQQQAVRQAITHAPRSVAGQMLEVLRQMIPSNIIQAAAKGQPLPVIFFSLFFGVMLTLAGEHGKPVTDFFCSLYEVIIRMVGVVLWLAPLAVFCLLAWTVARVGLTVFASAMGSYMATVLAGLGIHGLIVLPVVLLIFGKTNPLKFASQMRQALLTAFATDSSSATLPVTMRCAEQLGGVSPKASGFVLPLGATINMDGTALYEAVAVIFLAQIFEVQLGMLQWIIVALTATLAAVGAAGIPHAGLVTLIIVITAVNSSVRGVQIPEYAVFIILGVDRILDMCRTTVNVWGDAVGAKIITRLEPS